MSDTTLLRPAGDCSAKRPWSPRPNPLLSPDQAIRAVTTGSGPKWFNPGLTRPEADAALAELHQDYLRRTDQTPAVELGRHLLEHPAGVQRWYSAWRATTRSLQPHDQVEILQEGMVKFLQDFAAGKGPRYTDDRGTEAFGAWLYLVWRRRFRTLVLAHARKSGRAAPLQPAVEEGLQAPGANDCPFAAEDTAREVEKVRVALEAELSELGEKYQHPELWLACWRGDRPWKDLARACGVEPSYLSRLWPRVLERLLRRLGGAN